MSNLMAIIIGNSTFNYNRNSRISHLRVHH